MFFSTSLRIATSCRKPYDFVSEIIKKNRIRDFPTNSFSALRRTLLTFLDISSMYFFSTFDIWCFLGVGDKQTANFRRQQYKKIHFVLTLKWHQNSNSADPLGPRCGPRCAGPHILRSYEAARIVPCHATGRRSQCARSPSIHP